MAWGVKTNAARMNSLAAQLQPADSANV
jgi:hypothetical protein